jgi:zinc transport system substrate-binding protein
LTSPQTGCLHDYQLTPKDLTTLEDADIFVINGAGMESFMDKVIAQRPNLKIVEASKGMELIKYDKLSAGVNPHIWVSISGAIQEVKNIGEQLKTIDSKHAEQYKTNTDNFVLKLEAEKEKMHKELSEITNRNIITFHEAFPYFAKEFNLNIVSVIEREPGSEPSAEERKETIEIVKSSGVKALFAEPQYSTKAAETISQETGAKVYTLDPIVSGPEDIDSYIKIMDENLAALKEALK